MNISSTFVLYCYYFSWKGGIPNNFIPEPHLRSWLEAKEIQRVNRITIFMCPIKINKKKHGKSPCSMRKSIINGHLIGGLEHLVCFYILGNSSSQLTNSSFSEGWLHHQPDNHMSVSSNVRFAGPESVVNSPSPGLTRRYDLAQGEDQRVSRFMGAMHCHAGMGRQILVDG